MRLKLKIFLNCKNSLNDINISWGSSPLNVKLFPNTKAPAFLTVSKCRLLFHHLSHWMPCHRHSNIKWLNYLIIRRTNVWKKNILIKSFAKQWTRMPWDRCVGACSPSTQEAEEGRLCEFRALVYLASSRQPQGCIVRPPSQTNKNHRQLLNKNHSDHVFPLS